jgi:hypothetical protein
VVPKAQQFKLDDVAEFDDGLVIDIAGTVADEAAKTDRGAEATNGEIVIASIRLENNTKKPYDAQDVLIAPSTAPTRMRRSSSTEPTSCKAASRARSSRRAERSRPSASPSRGRS